MLSATDIEELLQSRGLDARRSLGQNFVVDPNTVSRIARLAGVGAEDHIVEIGPGLGSLTLALAETGASVLAIEKDRELVPLLAEVLERHGAAGVTVMQADALGLDWPAVLGDRSWSLVANLPYNVAVPLIMEVLERAPMVQRMLVMVQREVAERLVAGPGGRTVGIPSMRVAWFARGELLGTVPPEVFVPRPRVTSALVRLTRRPPPTTEVGPEQVFPLVADAYRQRRKMLRSTIGRRLDPEVFSNAGIEPTDRPEQLDIQDWARLAIEVEVSRR